MNASRRIWAWRALLMLLAIAVPLVGCQAAPTTGGQSQAVPTAEPAKASMKKAKIGVVLAQTGDMAVFGRTMIYGWQLARDELKAKGDVDIEWLLEDDQGKRDESIRLFERMINTDKVHAILGPLTSAQMFAAGPVANEKGLIAFGSATTAPKIDEIGPYVFRDAVSGPVLNPRAIKAAKEAWGIKRAAIIACKDDEAMLGEYNAFKATLQAEGVEIVNEQECFRADLDYSAQLTKLRDLDFDVLVVAALGENAAGIARQARELGITPKHHLVGGLPFNDPRWVEIAAGGMEGMIFMGAYHPSATNARNQEFVKAYTARFNEAPTQFAAQTYDAVYLLADAVKRANLTGDIVQDRKVIRDALAATSKFEGALGTLTAKGQNIFPESPGVVLTVKDGKIMPLGQ